MTQEFKFAGQTYTFYSKVSIDDVRRIIAYDLGIFPNRLVYVFDNKGARFTYDKKRPKYNS